MMRTIYYAFIITTANKVISHQKVTFRYNSIEALVVTVTVLTLSRYYWTVDNANLLRFTRRSYHLD